MRALLIVCALAAAAHADPDEVDNWPQPVARPERPAHGSFGVGSALDFGSASRTAAVAALDYLPGGKFGTWGVTLGVRDVGWSPFARHGSATLGVIREAAAARPLLAVLVHGDVGLAWRDGASTLPLVGGGLKTYLKLQGSFGIALDTTNGELVVEVLDQLSTNSQNSIVKNRMSLREGDRNRRIVRCNLPPES